MRPLGIVIAGEPVAAAFAARGSYSDMIRRAVGAAWSGPWEAIAGRSELPDPQRFAGLIVTGSAAHVPTREPWIVEIERYLARAVAAQVPIFGICFGHQLLAQALGGLVSENPNGREIGTVAVEFAGSDPLLEGCASSFGVNMTHLDSVVALPPGAERLATSALDGNAMIRFAERVWGVQFHPEFDAEIMGHYVAARRGALVEERLDAHAIEAGIADTPASQAILRRFAASQPSKC